MNIEEERATIEAELDGAVWSMTDFDGSLLQRDPTEAEEVLLGRLKDLEAIACLKLPISKTEWGLDMIVGFCCEG